MKLASSATGQTTAKRRAFCANPVSPPGPGLPNSIRAAETLTRTLRKLLKPPQAE